MLPFSAAAQFAGGGGGAPAFFDGFEDWVDSTKMTNWSKGGPNNSIRGDTNVYSGLYCLLMQEGGTYVQRVAANLTGHNRLKLRLSSPVAALNVTVDGVPLASPTTTSTGVSGPGGEWVQYVFPMVGTASSVIRITNSTGSTTQYFDALETYKE